MWRGERRARHAVRSVGPGERFRHACRRSAPNHLAIALEQLQSDRPCHQLLDLPRERVERLSHRSEPEAVVYQIRVLQRKLTLQPLEIPRQHERLELAMCRVEDYRGRRLRDLAGHDLGLTLLDRVHAAYAMAACNRGE